MIHPGFRGIRTTVLLLSICVSATYAQITPADVVIQNGLIYTVNSDVPWVQALAIKDGRIQSIGTNEDIQELIGQQTRVIDAKNNFVMPGFIEGHGHFGGLGSSLQNLNFLKSKSWQEIVDAVEEKVKDSEPGEWIIGGGWHQEKWADTLMRNVLGYPYHEALSAISPDNPVMLRHASGHGLMANSLAMQKAGITGETPNPSGGNIVRDMQGEAIGVFEENAMGAVTDAYREYTTTLSKEEMLAKWYEGVALAEAECLSNGVTSFQDAGSSLTELARYKQLAEDGELDVRLWAMIRHTYAYLNDKLEGYPIIDAGDGYFTSRAIKLSIDGALGSYGAWLLEPYDDKPGAFGQNTSSIKELYKLAGLCTKHKLQLCVHAIGDRANREVLDAYEVSFREISAHPENFRWRIEHAQHLHPDDIPRFAEFGIIAAMQGIHCTSDAPFVEKRLGAQRAKDGAYVWQSLLKSGAVVTNGTDVPVEDISTIESFYASVTRKRADSGMEFYPAQAMSREEAIYSYTMANAYAAFEEEHKGSIKPGKYADIVILSEDLIRCDEQDILSTKVLMTLVGGSIKYSSGKLNK
ncbi:MAG: amidohydrolase [Bacteroidetes bacterium]|nr:MAG: amidohydrolase [Bacteroidota bacterium]